MSLVRWIPQRCTHLLQLLCKRLHCEFSTQTSRGSKLSQPIRVRETIANGGCDACGSRFLENDSVTAVVHDLATKFRGDNGQAVRLRFELCYGKSIRERRENEYVCVSVKLSCLLPRYGAKPFHVSGIPDCAGMCDFDRANHPKFNRLITQNSSGLQQPGDALAEID